MKSINFNRYDFNKIECVNCCLKQPQNSQTLAVSQFERSNFSNSIMLGTDFANLVILQKLFLKIQTLNEGRFLSKIY